MNHNPENELITDDRRNRDSDEADKIINNEFLEFRRELCKVSYCKSIKSNHLLFKSKKSLFDYLNFLLNPKKS